MVVLSSINLRMMTVGIDQQDLSDTLYLLISGAISGGGRCAPVLGDKISTMRIGSSIACPARLVGLASDGYIGGHNKRSVLS